MSLPVGGKHLWAPPTRPGIKRISNLSNHLFIFNNLAALFWRFTASFIASLMPVLFPAADYMRLGLWPPAKPRTRAERTY